MCMRCGKKVKIQRTTSGVLKSYLGFVRTCIQKESFEDKGAFGQISSSHTAIYAAPPAKFQNKTLLRLYFTSLLNKLLST